jgi:hypothetical protein
VSGDVLRDAATWPPFALVLAGSGAVSARRGTVLAGWCGSVAALPCG